MLLPSENDDNKGSNSSSSQEANDGGGVGMMLCHNCGAMVGIGMCGVCQEDIAMGNNDDDGVM